MPPTEDQLMRLGAYIRTEREAHGLSMDELSKQADIGRSSLHRLENGTGTKPQPANLARILRVLDIDAATIEPLLPTDDPRWTRRTMASLTTPGEVRTALAGPTPASGVDLLAIKGEAVVNIAVLRGGEADRLDLARALNAAGYSVTQPVPV